MSFRDAIGTIRALGHDLIWIDSLCIIQDDEQDWQRESSRMASTYRHAALTIAVTRAMNSEMGCFPPIGGSPYIWISRSGDSGASEYLTSGPNDKWKFIHIQHPKLWVPFAVTIGRCSRHFILRPGHDLRSLQHEGEYGNWATNIKQSNYPLLSCAWPYQERMLSPQIVHFGPNEIAWECCEAFWSKSYGAEYRHVDEAIPYRDQEMRRRRISKDGDYAGRINVANSHKGEFPIERARRMLISLMDEELPRSRLLKSLGLKRYEECRNSDLKIELLRKTWHRIIEEFTRLNITFEMDRLPALSGLASAVSASFQSLHDGDINIPTPMYLAGIWSNCLPYSLLWTCSPNSRRTSKYRAPTFSWASVEGAITFQTPLTAESKKGDPVWRCEIVNRSSTPLGLDPHGQVKAGFIEVFGWTGNATVITAGSASNGGNAIRGIIEQDQRKPGGPEPITRRQGFYQDISPHPCAKDSVEITPGDEVLVLLIECEKTDRYGYRVMALVLRFTEQQHAYQRVGLICPDIQYVEGHRDLFLWPSGWFPEKRTVKII
ncbi:hypothetical protein F4679DRAFT_569372, partial [Xylaria curta]